MRIKQKLVVWLPQIVIAALVIAAIYLVSNEIGQEGIREVVRGAGFWGPVVFVFLYSLTYIFAPFSGMPFFLSGFALFGKTFIFYAYLSAFIGVIVNFWIARLWGRVLVARLVGRENVGKIDAFTKNHGVKTLIFLRITQGNLADYISYAFGLTNMRFLPYLLVSVLVPIPWLLVWWFVLFPRVESYQDFLIVFLLSITPVVIVSLILFFRFWRKHSR